MRKFYPMLLLAVVYHTATAQREDSVIEAEIAREYAAYYAYIDSMEQHLDYRTGEIVIGKELAKINLPDGYRYLDPESTQHIVTDTWGNPPSETLGMIIPGGINPYGISGWGVVLSYEEEGHVEDDDAASIDYDELLREMQEEVALENEVRLEQGYDTYQLRGWAEDPHYDAGSHKLFWALNLHFGMEEEDYPGTLNYNVRVLGREGVLVLNAVSGMEHLPEVREHMESLIPSVAFTQGNRYEEYNPSSDKLAAYGVGALVAGNLAAKTGLLAMFTAFLGKSWKFILLGVAGLAALIKKHFTARQNAGESRRETT